MSLVNCECHIRPCPSFITLGVRLGRAHRQPSHISKIIPPTILLGPPGRIGIGTRAAVAKPLIDPPDLSLLYPNRPPTSIGAWQASESGPDTGHRRRR